MYGGMYTSEHLRIFRLFLIQAQWLSSSMGFTEQHAFVLTGPVTGMAFSNNATRRRSIRAMMIERVPPLPGGQALEGGCGGDRTGPAC